MTAKKAVDSNDSDGAWDLSLLELMKQHQITEQKTTIC